MACLAAKRPRDNGVMVADFKYTGTFSSGPLSPIRPKRKSRLNPPEVERGAEFTISYFFRCTAPVDEDWLVFIHGDGPQGGAHRVFGDHAPLGGLYPTSEWKVGDLVQDDYQMTVPSNYPYESFTLWMGLWKGNQRLSVAQRYAHDGDNRVRTAFVRVR